jgi:hypothetical protein
VVQFTGSKPPVLFLFRTISDHRRDERDAVPVPEGRGLFDQVLFQEQGVVVSLCFFCLLLLLLLLDVVESVDEKHQLAAPSSTAM